MGRNDDLFVFILVYVLMCLYMLSSVDKVDSAIGVVQICSFDTLMEDTGHFSHYHIAGFLSSDCTESILPISLIYLLAYLSSSSG